MYNAIRNLQPLFDASPIPAFAIYKNHNVILWNKALEHFSGIKKKEVLNTSDHWRAFYRRKRPMMADLHLEGKYEQISKLYPGHFVRKDAAQESYVGKAYRSKLCKEGKWLNFTSSAIKGVGGKIDVCLITVENYAKKENEYKYDPVQNKSGKYYGHIWRFHEKEKHENDTTLKTGIDNVFKNIFENSIVGIYRTTPDGHCLNANPAFATMLGYASPDEMMASIHDLAKQCYVQKKDRDKIKKILDKNDVVECYEAQMKKKDGAKIWISISASAVRDKTGNINCYIGTNVDISKRKRMEFALRDSEMRLSQIADTINEAFWIYDPLCSKLIYFNKAFLRLLNLLPNKKTIGINKIKNAVHPDDLFRLSEPIKKLEEFNCEFRIILSDGQIRWFRARGYPKSNQMVGTATDITAYKNASMAIERQRLQLIQADKMASLGILVSGVAHEINNPASFTLFNASLLKTTWEGVLPILHSYMKENGDFNIGGMNFSKVSANVLPLINGIKEGAERIQRIVSVLKDYVRQDTNGNKELLNINDVVQSAVSILSTMCRKHTNNFRVELSANVLSTIGNHQQLEQVIINLIQNACESLTSRDQSIVVRTTDSVGKGHIAVIVSDQGSGIKPTDLTKITAPFFTTKQDYGGTGLGLSVSDGIVKDHGGRLSFESNVGKGTIVTLLLPGKNNK